MARIRRNSEQTLEFKIEQAEAKVARTREAHEKAVDELKKLYDIRKAYQRDELLKALESSHRSYDDILAFYHVIRRGEIMMIKEKNLTNAEKNESNHWISESKKSRIKLRSTAKSMMP